MNYIFISNRQTIEDNQTSLITEKPHLVDFEQVETSKFVAIDFETSGLNPHSYLPLLCTVRFDDEDTIYCFDLLCDDAFFKFDELLSIVKKKNLLVAGHNIKYDLNVILALFKDGILSQFADYRSELYDLINLRLYDTMITHQTLYKGSSISASLSSVLLTELGVNLSKVDRISFVGIKDKDYQFSPAQLLYAMRDVEYIYPLFLKQVSKLPNKQIKDWLKIEFNLIPIVARLEFEGVKLDVEKWTELLNQNKATFREIETNLDKMLVQLGFKVPDRYLRVGSQLGMFGIEGSDEEILNDEAINYNSPVQINKIYKSVSVTIPSDKYGDEGTGKDNIERFIRENPYHDLVPFSNLLLEHRKYSKRISSFGEKFLEFAKLTGRVHTSYKQNATSTGRFSSGDSKNGFPNMAQIPRSNEYRTCFLVDKGMVGMTIDLAQAELRILASESGDKTLIDLVMSGDTHGYLATKAMRKLYNDDTFEVSKTVNSELRTKFKNVIFGLAYGATTSRIAELLNISLSEAEIVYSAIYEEIPNAVDWLERKADEAIETGRVVFNDVTKTFRIFENTKEFENSIRREAKNCGIQGTNANMIKHGMVEVDKLLKRHNSKGAILLQIYDELFIQFEKEFEQTLPEQIQVVLNQTCNLYLKNGVEMVSEYSLGGSWIK